jgi:hypothetical protein
MNLNRHQHDIFTCHQNGLIKTIPKTPAEDKETLNIMKQQDLATCLTSGKSKQNKYYQTGIKPAVHQPTS